MLFKKIARLAGAGVLAGAALIPNAYAEKFTLHGASQFDETHAFTRLMRKFEALTKLYYTGPHEIEFVMHLNSELGSRVLSITHGRLRRVLDFNTLTISDSVDPAGTR